MPTVTGIATSFIDFTRASNATVTDSDGKVKWAPHNLLLASESFDAAAWAKSSVTPTANSIAAPNGTTTADTLAASGANGTTLQTFTAEAISYTFGVWLKRKTGTGNIQIAADSGTYTTVTITSDWALYTVTQTPAAGSKSAGIRIVTSADEVYAWGASLYRSDLGGMQPNTSAYPMYNPTTPKNLLGYTEDFTQGVGAGYGSIGVSNVATAPNGLMTADELRDDGTASNYHYMVRSVATVANSTYVLSGYFKANTSNYVILSVANFAGPSLYAGASFNLTSGTLASSGAVGTGYSVVGTPTITAVGSSGWYRCAVVVTAGTTAPTTFAVGLTNDGTFSNYGLKVYNGSGSGIFGWGIQVSDSASLDTYVPVYGAFVASAAYYGPRRDFDPVTLACKGLLVEEQRTNIVRQSSDFTTTWVPVAAGTGVTPAITANNAIAPDGTQTADLITLNRGAGNTASDYSVLVIGVSGYVATNSYIGSLWIKAATGSDVGKQIAIRHVGSSGMGVYTLTESWQRITRTEVAFSTSGTFDIYNYGPTTADNTVSFHAWGAQLEIGASAAATTFATSYIPTGSASATRNADVASVSTQAFPYSQGVGSLVVNWKVGQTTNPADRLIWLDDTDASVYDNYISLRQGGAVPTAGAQGTVDTSASASASVVVNTPSLSVGSDYKAAFAFAANDLAFCLNGGTVGTNASATVPSGIDLMRIAGHRDGTYLNGHIRQITYIPRRLSNAELQSRST